MAKSGIWIKPDKFREFSEPQKAQSLANELATRDRFYYSFANLWLGNPDPVLKKMGKDITVYRDLFADATVQGTVKSREAGVLSLQWGIDRGRSRSAQAQIVEDLFSNIDMQRVFAEALQAVQFGYSPLEVLWEKVGPYLLPRDIIGKPQEWFVFDNNNQLRLQTMTNTEGEPVPERKFLLPRQRPSYMNPYGFPDLSCCFWPVTFKKGGVKFWVTFMEKFGMPYVIGKTPRGTDGKENDLLADQLEAMVQDAIAVVPDDSSVELLFAEGKSGSSDLYKDLVAHCKSEISTVQLGHEGAAQSTPGKLGNDNTAMQVRKEITQADQRIVEATVNELIGWIWELNFTGERPVFSMWQEEDVDDALAKRDETLTRTGVRFKKSYYVEAYGLDETQFDLAEPKASAPAAAIAAAFSEKNAAYPDQQAIDAMLDGITDVQLQAQAEALVKPLLTLFNESSTYAEVLEKLTAQFPAMNTDALIELVSRARFVAQTHGRATGKDS
jgi:phage gp29-like protein